MASDSLRSPVAVEAGTRALHLGTVCAAFVVAGCALSHGRHEPDAASAPDARASPLDAGTRPERRDAGPDAPETDAGPPTTGCFSDEVTIATVTPPEPGARAHVRPLALAARERGWIAIYEDSIRAERYVLFLDVDGSVRGTSPLEYGFTSIRGVFLDGSSMLVVWSEGVQRVELGDAEILREYGALWISDISSDPIEVVETASLEPSGALRVLSRHAGDRLRVTDLELDDDSTYGLAARSGDLRDAPRLGGGLFALQGDSLEYIGPVPDSWRRPWHAMRVQLGVGALGTGEQVGWRVVEDTVWDDPPSRVSGITSDDRLLTTREEPPGLPPSYLEPTPLATAPEPSRARLGDAPALAMIERPGWYVGVLWQDRFGVFGYEDLEPSGELSFAWTQHPYVARANDVVAVLFERAPGPDDPSERILGLRCMLLPR